MIEGVRVVEFRAEHVQRVKMVVIRPGGEAVVQITGANAQGKTSTLNALGWLFGGKGEIPADPIRRGADRAVIQADLGEIIVRRTLNRKDDGFTTALYVEAANGARFQSPQAVIDGFMGALSFDPLAFMRQEPKIQFDVLRRFVPDVDFDAIDKANAADFNRRTDVNREIDRCRKSADAIEVPADLPADPVNEMALLEQMTTAAQTNAGIEAERGRRNTEAGLARAQLGRVLITRQQASAARRRADEMDAEADAQEREANAVLGAHASLPPLAEPVDVTHVRRQIEDARTINSGIIRRPQRDKLQQQAAEQEWLAEALTDSIDARNKQKREAIAAAKMPVEGLGFGGTAPCC